MTLVLEWRRNGRFLIMSKSFINEVPKGKEQANNPLHGVKLEEILEYLVAEYWWDELAERINIQCFKSNPSIKSCLKFLRKTPWAREKVERLYLQSIGK
jgi:uncharacterized protein (DUF2132 family)